MKGGFHEPILMALPILAASLLLLSTAGCSLAPTATAMPTQAPVVTADPDKPADATPLADKPTGGAAENYSLAQAMSDQAQLSTIAFDGLAFLTGTAGADSFFPPGKVADFFGFQYMRDVDVSGYGHNTTFLSKAANTVLSILDDAQKAKLVSLAKEQAPIYERFALARFPLMEAFRRSMEGVIPTGSTGLDATAVSEYTGLLYGYDAELSYRRAVVVGGIVTSFTTTQKATLDAMKFDDSSTWRTVGEDEALKKSLTNTQFVAVMTYASELFSWYKGSIDADIYFCPERHGTCFGGFYMKDQPAMGNPDYFISTSTTGDKGQGFLDILDATQRALVTRIIEIQRPWLAEIATIRTAVSTELRKALTGGTVDEANVKALIQRYGELDGLMSALYAERFAEVARTLTEAQRTKLVALRDQTVVPAGAFEFSTPITMPTPGSVDFLFGIGTVPTSLP